MDLEQLNDMIDGEYTEDFTHFPMHIFPVQIQRLIDNAYETKGFNKDFFSAGILSVCATAIGNSVSLHNGSYYSKPILWVAIIGRRGTGKTHPLTFAKKPLEEIDNAAYIEYKQNLDEYNKAEKKGEKPHYKKMLLKDFTPEKLAENLQHNEKGLAIVNDELMRWINSFDQYKKGGDQQLYLDLFNGNELTVDRVTKDPIRVAETNVNIFGGMQPEILKGMAKNNRSEDGFLDRFLFVYPNKTEPIRFTGLDINDIHKSNYAKLINNLYGASQQIIYSSASNIALYKEWQHKKVFECQRDNLEAPIQAKLETYVWRLALVIEMMLQASSGSFNNELGDESIRKAIDLVEYFRHNALKVHDNILSNNPLTNLTEIQINIYKELPYEFKRGDVLSIFTKNSMKGGTIGRFLNNTNLFIRVDSNGHYRKKH